jgi:hypothetical protein
LESSRWEEKIVLEIWGSFFLSFESCGKERFSSEIYTWEGDDLYLHFPCCILHVLVCPEYIHLVPSIVTVNAFRLHF